MNTITDWLTKPLAELNIADLTIATLLIVWLIKNLIKFKITIVYRKEEKK